MPRSRTVPGRTGRAMVSMGAARRGARCSEAPAGLEQHRRGGEIMPYVYGLVGFVVTIVLAIIVLQLLL